MKQLGVCSMIVLCLGLARRAEAATATWDPNPEPDVLGYVLAYGTESGVYTTEIDVGNVLSYEFFSPPGYRYYVVVRAYSAWGAGPYSSEVVLDLTAPPADPPPPPPPSVVEPADIAVAADFDGDGQLDPAVYNRDTGEWRLSYSSSPGAPPVSIVWGAAGDFPVQEDYDGDRRADIAVYRPWNGMWYVLLSSSGLQSHFEVQWGDDSSYPMPFDYDLDGRADPTIFRGLELQILLSSSQYTLSVVWK